MDEALAKMKVISHMPGANLPTQILACAIGSSCFCYLFGGSIPDSLAAVFVGVALCVCQYFMGRAKISKMMQTIFGSMVVTLMGMFMTWAGTLAAVALNMDKIIIGGLIILVPGIPFTTSIRDFFNGDYLSGTIRMIDALIVAVCMAIGVGVVYKIFL